MSEVNCTLPNCQYKTINNNLSNLPDPLCTRCGGPMPMGYEQPAYPIAGIIDKMQKDIRKMTDLMDMLLTRVDLL